MMSKQEQQKKIIKLLQENPIIQVACHKAGISRSTFYRWTKEDCEFKKICKKAVRISTDIANDAVESVLFKKAREGDMRAVPYWLNNNHPKYRDAYQGYNERRQALLQGLKDRKDEEDKMLDQEREELIKLFELAKSMSEKKAIALTGEYCDNLISA